MSGLKRSLWLFPSVWAAFLCDVRGAEPVRQQPTASIAAVDQALNAKVFDRVWRLIDERYYDATFHGVDWDAMASKYRPAALAAENITERYRVLNQLTAELHDKHVYAFLPQLVHEGRALSRPDTGLRYRKVDEAWVVTDIVPESPAERGGIQRGWLIGSREGRTISDDALAERLSLQVGRPVTFMFRDEHDRAYTVSLVPELLPLDSTRFVSTGIPGGGRYLRFDHFDSSAVDWLNREIKAHRNAPGLLVDLRNNHGGHQTALRRVVRAFFPTVKASARPSIARAGLKSWIRFPSSPRIIPAGS